MKTNIKTLKAIMNIHLVIGGYLLTLKRNSDIEFINKVVNDFINGTNNLDETKLNEINDLLETTQEIVAFYQRTKQFELSDSLKNKTCDMVLEYLKNLVIKKIVGN